MEVQDNCIAVIDIIQFIRIINNLPSNCLAGSGRGTVNCFIELPIIDCTDCKQSARLRVVGNIDSIINVVTVHNADGALRCVGTGRNRNTSECLVLVGVSALRLPCHGVLCLIRNCKVNAPMLSGLANVLVIATKNILALGVDIRIIDLTHHGRHGILPNSLHRGRHFCTAVDNTTVNRKLRAGACANQCDCCVALSGGCRVVIHRIN